MKKNLLFVLIFMLLAVSAVSADDLSEVRQAGVLRFGAPLEYIPFVFNDETGNASGMDVALMEEVARRLGVRLQKLTFARDGIIDALNYNQIDVIGGGLSKTDARARRIDFTRTYYNGEATFISLTALPKPQIVGPDSFRGMRIGVVKGSSFQEWIQDNLVDTGIIPFSQVFTYYDSADGMKALDNRDIDLIAIDQDVFDSRYKAAGTYQVFYSGFNTENYAFGVRKGSTLAEAINTQLVSMLKDGTAQSIANRFFSMDYSKWLINKPVSTLVPVMTSVPSGSTCVNAMSYVKDVTIRDGEVFGPNESFRKTWRIYNNGSCTWDQNYTLQLVNGEGMNGSSVRIPTVVKPGQTVDVSVDLVAPGRSGAHKGYWQMRSPQGAGFGQTIWVSIRVDGNAPAPAPRPDDGQKRIIPVIDSLYLSSSEGTMGDSTTVYWSVHNAAGVTITCNGTTIENSGTLTGSAPVSAVIQRPGVHEIKLTAHSVTDDTSASVYYTMYGQSDDGQTRKIPTINYFYADSDSGHTGDSVTVYWSTNANGVTINVDGYNIVNSTASGSYTLQAPVQGSGSHTITLTAHTVTDDVSESISYFMYEREDAGGNYSGGGNFSDGDNNDGNDGQQQTVPSIDYVYASPDEGYSGDGTTVYWSATNAFGVTISVDGNVIDNSSASGSYSLQAPIQGAGTHTITITAHSVTNDISDSCTFIMHDRDEGLDNDDDEIVYDDGRNWDDSEDYSDTAYDTADYDTGDDYDTSDYDTGDDYDYSDSGNEWESYEEDTIDDDDDDYTPTPDWEDE